MNRTLEDALIFISQSTPHINAVFGGLMALRASHLSTADAVVDGNLRLEEHYHLDYPVQTPLQLSTRDPA